MTSNANMITEIKRYLYEPELNSNDDATLINQDIVLNLMNRAIDELSIETLANYNVYTYTEATASAPTSKTFAELTNSNETNLFKLEELLIKEPDTNDYREIWRLNVEDKKDVGLASNDNTLGCTIYNDTIYFTTGLSSSAEVVISGRWKKTNIDETGNYPLHPITEQAVVYFCVAHGKFIQGESEQGAVWYKLYENRKLVVQKYFENLIDAKMPYAFKSRKRSNSAAYTSTDAIYQSGSITP